MGSAERAQRAILPLPQAIHQAVKATKGGVAAIAGANDFNANTLQLKVNPNTTSHRLNLDEFEAILSYTRDPRLMDSLCALYGNAIWIDLGNAPLAEGLTTSAMLQQIGEASSNLGRLAQDVGEALSDGRITRDELAIMEKTSMRLIQSIQTLLEKARADVERQEAEQHG